MTTSVYQDRLSSGWDKVLFLVAWIGGTVGLLMLKIFVPNDWPSPGSTVRDWALIGWTCAVLLGYAGSLWRSPQFKVREDRAGDSCYYLGFLFTLSSLAYALWEFGRLGNNIGQVIENFAVALASTIVGLVLRVLFQQFREDPFEVEQEVRLELSDAAARLKTQVSQAVEEFATLRTAIGQELRNEFTRSVTQIAKECTETIKTTTQEHSAAVVAVVGKMQECADGMRDQVTSVKASSKRIVDAFDKLADRLAKTDVPTKPLDDAIQTLASLVSETVEREASRLEQQLPRLESISAAALTTKAAMEQVAGEAKSFEQAVGRIAVATAGIPLVLDEFTKGLDAGAKNWANATKTEAEAIKTQFRIVEDSQRVLDSLKDGLTSALNQSQDAVIKTQRSLASLAQAVIERV